MDKTTRSQRDNESYLSYLEPRIQSILEQATKSRDNLTEVRLRIDQPLTVHTTDGVYFVSPKGHLLTGREEAYKISKTQIDSTFRNFMGHSLYAKKDEIKEGFITVEGGHRVGFVGRGVYRNGVDASLTDISSMNIRIARQQVGVAESYFKKIGGLHRFDNTLIISPPGLGKTTFLRDMIRILSSNHYTVGLIDERNEIAGTSGGSSSLDVGPLTDVLTAIQKREGVSILLRTMAPKIIAMDEVFSMDDYLAIEEIIGAGVKIIATAHGPSLSEIMKREAIQKMIKNHGFSYLVTMRGFDKEPQVEVL